MKTVLVTGFQGFIGQNLLLRLEKEKKYIILKYGRHENLAILEEYIKVADCVFHLAGINRPVDELEFIEGNTNLTKLIVDILINNNKKIDFIFSSSTQAAIDNPYGISKAKSEEEIVRYKNATHSNIFIYRLPNIFGKGAKPNYNSVVATFIYNIVNDREIFISNPNKTITLVYIEDLLDEFIKTLEGKTKVGDKFYFADKTYEIRLEDLAKCIYDIKNNKKNDMAIYKPLYETFQTYLWFC